MNLRISPIDSQHIETYNLNRRTVADSVYVRSLSAVVRNLYIQQIETGAPYNEDAGANGREIMRVAKGPWKQGPGNWNRSRMYSSSAGARDAPSTRDSRS